VLFVLIVFFSVSLCGFVVFFVCFVFVFLFYAALSFFFFLE